MNWPAWPSRGVKQSVRFVLLTMVAAIGCRGTDATGIVATTRVPCTVGVALCAVRI